VTLPGPAFGPWAVGLLLFAAASALTGGAVRTAALRFLPSGRTLGPVERLLIDLYLGGATVYALAILPFGLFTAATFPVVLALAAASLLLRAARLGRAKTRQAVERAVSEYLAYGPAIALAAAGALGLLELALAIGVPTGNTYDASQLATYTSLLIQHRSVPTTLTGVGLAVPVVYPQGTAVWMASAQLLFGLPAARTAVLVTPMFFALAPLGAYALGDRWLGGAKGGATLAVTFLVLATWTRLQVSGSYDFVAAFPLVLLLIALSQRWLGDSPVSWREAAAFGLLAGYAAALNPVGVGWWLLALPVAAGFTAGARWAGDARRWFARFGAALVASTVPILPSIVGILGGLGHLGFSRGEPSVGTIAPVGLTGPQVVGYIDPFLFRPNDIWLSPFLSLRLELAVLLVVGAMLLVLRPASAGDRSLLARLAVAGGASTAVWFLLEWLASSGMGPLDALAPLTSGGELAEMLFTVFVILAALPILILVERPAPIPRVHSTPSAPRWRADPLTTPTLAVLIALLLFVPAVAVTATQVPPSVQATYTSFGNVSAADFALLAWAPDHLPSGARVVVAPGSAAAFLPAYAPGLRVLYPMVVGFAYPNATYRDLVRELTNGTMAPNATADLRLLDAGYIAVTERNSVLGAPFALGPLLAEPADFPIVFHDGDAYVFAVDLPSPVVPASLLR
jgi:hypothetical protein